MSFAIVLSANAEKEIISSFNWYEDRVNGLGTRFVTHIEKAILQIQQHPELYPNKSKNYRELVVGKFPYVIIYEVLKEEQTIHILNVFNTYRNPKQKYNRQP